ncbi:hypothetical protein FNH09_05165 [Streptomyces adustus]|uniref:Uncharacterized protein n=1 Tax=Streptomyces adustus TaxID=1609272 RepID=A0A5N8V9V2_9ACTN|nr:hypothetical protein [Streptomyces adustus]MPY30725.1 hypothetical protein [Streptomyces adustus]
MTELQFELQSFSRREKGSRKGLVNGFGEVTVTVKRRKRSTRAGFDQLTVRLHGEQMPAIEYCTVGPQRPTLKNSRFRINGHVVQLAFNDKAFRNTSRALTFSYHDRSYRYTVIGFEKGSKLSRPGVLITVTRGNSTLRKGMSSFGAVTGDADALDVALALIFEEINTTELTTSGLVSDVLNRILNPRADELGE